MAAALSLVCRECDVQLKSVAECQTHNELTGHTKFEESTEPVLNLTCTECGKPCRTQTERDLHTKRTGHTNYVDKTDEAKPMDTEAEMKQAAEELKEDSGKAPASNEPVEMVPPQVSEDLVSQLEGMGFSKNKAVRALHFTGSELLETAINWLVEHEADMDLDEPLLVPKKDVKPKLSPEEARKAAEELVRLAKEKRAKEEAELERVRERERVRAGKELLLAKRQEDDLRLKRNMEERKREKEEERRAREKIRIKLEEDRKERRRKLGLPEELTEEEKAKAEEEARAKEAKAEEKKKAGMPPPKPVTALQKLRETLVAIKKAHPGQDERTKACYATMLKYLGNIAGNPGEEKFRRIRLSNDKFRTAVGSLEGAISFLEQCGFRKDTAGEFLEMPRENVSVELLNAAGSELNNALTNPFFGAL